MSQITGKTWVNGEVITHTGLNLPDPVTVTGLNDLAGRYHTLLTANSITSADVAAGSYFLGGAGVINSSWDSGSDLMIATVVPPTIYFDNADADGATTLTQKLRVRAQVLCNTVSWSSVTATFGLYPVTFAGGNDILTLTLGTVVSGSTVEIANPTSVGNPNQGNSGDFTIPSDGQYALGVVTSAQLTNNAAALLSAQLQTRSV